jgi:predicted nucleotidyltransferase
MQKDITLYPDINEFLQELLDELQDILDKNLVGVYLYGSLVWGDFDYNSSDIDILVATSSDIDQKTFDQLDEMQKNLAKRYKHAREGMIEIVYASVHALQTFKTKRSQIAVINPGDEPFRFKDAGIDWLMNWYIIQEKAITLFGALPKTIIAPTTKEEFIEAVKEHAKAWQNWTEDLKTRPSQAYAILTLCRAYYTYKNGKQTSKKKAAEWTAEELPQWSSVIENALKWREDWRNRKVDSNATLSDTKQFVNFIIDKICM